MRLGRSSEVQQCTHINNTKIIETHTHVVLLSVSASQFYSQDNSQSKTLMKDNYPQYHTKVTKPHKQYSYKANFLNDNIFYIINNSHSKCQVEQSWAMNFKIT